MNDQDPHQAEVADLTVKLHIAEKHRDGLRRRANAWDTVARKRRKRITELRSDPDSAMRIRFAEIRGPAKCLQDLKRREVKSINVVEPQEFPESVMLFLRLADGCVFDLTMTAEDAYKLERRLAWRLSELDRKKQTQSQEG